MSDKSNVIETGSIQYFEPNELYGGDNTPVDLDKLNMYINLYVKVPSRFSSTEHTEYDSVLGGSKFIFNNNETIIPLFTNDYVNVSYNELKNGAKFTGELFGITSIDVQFDVQLFPRVTINFTDVRGYGLMNQMELQHETNMKSTIKKDITAKSFFTSLFNFPYPIFTLEIKGYYGKNVTFDLSLEEFHTSFDSNTGNFNTTVTFIGALYGIFGDMPMSYLLIAPFLSSGEEKVNNIWKRIRGIEPTYLEMLNLYYKLISQKGCEDTETLNELKEVKDKSIEINNLIKIKTFYEGIIEEVKTSWEMAKNKKYKITTINFWLGDRQGFFKTNNINLINYIPEGEGFITDWTKLNKIFTEKISEKIFDYDFYMSKYGNNSNSYTGILIDEIIIERNECKNVKELYSEFAKLNQFFNDYPTLKEKWGIDTKTDSTDFEKYMGDVMREVSEEVYQPVMNGSNPYFVDKTKNESLVPSRSKICVYYFEDLKKKYKDICNEINKKNNNINDEDVKTSVGDYVASTLNFEPTIKVLYDILFKHLHCFSEIFLNVIKNCENYQLTLRQLIEGKNIFTDIPLSRIDNNIPPFPMLAEKDNKGQTLIKYPGSYSNFANRPEITLTEDIFNKMCNFKSDITAASVKINNEYLNNTISYVAKEYNFFADLRTDIDGNDKNYYILNKEEYGNYTKAQKANLIRDIFVSRLVTYSAMYYLSNGGTFAPNEADLLYASNANLFNDGGEMLQEIEQKDIDEIYGAYQRFRTLSNNFSRGFINYYPEAEKNIDNLDSKVLHNNGDKTSTCYIMHSGTTEYLLPIVEKYLEDSFFANIDNGADDGWEKHGQVTGDTFFMEYERKKDDHTMINAGIRAYCSEPVYFNWTNFEGKSNNRYILNTDANHLFDFYKEYVITAGTECNKANCVGCSRERTNNIVFMHISQIMQIGEWFYLREEKKPRLTTTNLGGPTTKNHAIPMPACQSPAIGKDFYYAISIDNKHFKKFCIDEYKKFLNDNNYYDKTRRYIIAKSWMYDNPNTTKIGKTEVGKAWDFFVKKIRKNNGLESDTSFKVIKEEQTKIEIERLEIKTSIYYTLKNLYDKWYSSMNENFFTFKNMSKNVKYYDTLSRDIGDTLAFDIYKFVNQIISFTSADGAPSDVISFMAQTAQANNCNFIVLPQYSDISLDEMFKPHSFYNGELKHNPYGASYIVMHHGNVSHHLDIVGGDYPNDGFDIANYYGNDLDDFTKNISNLSHMVAFGVTYGMQNQNIFRSISVDTKTPSISDYSIANTLLIADSTGQANHAVNNLNSQFLFPVYANRSYECTVEMMGCANIRPLMYFQLNNIPMFRGAYIITNVTHRITPNDFSTTFTGTRVSKYNIPLYDKTMSYSSFISLFDKRMKEGDESTNTYSTNTQSGKVDPKKSVVEIKYQGDLCFDLYRYYYNKNVTLGKLVLNGEFLCYTLEDRVRFTNEESEEMHGLKNQVGTGKGKYAAFKVYGKDARPGHTDKTEGFHAIPSNKKGYTLTPGKMSKLGERPLINNIPCFSGVFMHEGTSQWNTDGCVLMGDSANKTAETINDPNAITAYVAGLVKGATGKKTLKIHQSKEIKRKESGDVIATIDGKNYYDIDFGEDGFIEVDWTIGGTEVSKLKKHTRIESKYSETCSEDGYNNNKDKFLEKLKNTNGYRNVYEYIKGQNSDLLDYIDFDLRYTTVHNFMGEKMYGNIPQGKEGVFLGEDTCKKLIGALKIIKEDYQGNYKLVILDAARPSSVSYHMHSIVKEGKYAASCKGSKHNYGIAVDVTLKHKTSGDYVDMGPYLAKGSYTDTNYDINKSFDLFHPVSAPGLAAETYTGKTVKVVNGKIEEAKESYILTDSHVTNRGILSKIMKGWNVAKTEWWHFTNSSGTQKLLDF